jgi:uncharacterized protein
MTKAIRLGIAAIALHVLDDNFIQPNPGTSATDHLVSGLIPLALLALAAWALPRLRTVWQGALSIAIGIAGLAGGAEAVAAGHLSGDDFTGVLSLLAGVALLGLGAASLWHGRGRSLWRRAGFGLGGLVVAALVGVPVTLGYVFTHVSRAKVPAPRLGAAYQDVSFTTSDGLTLRGWYVPSRNGAAVIAFPGRKGPQRQARMLIRHGYGVLLFDRRGEGASDGDPNAFGWGGARDVDAAVAFLRRRPDVRAGRIGGIGLSVGGEMMLEAAAGNRALRAVVSEGAGARSLREEYDSMHGVDKFFGVTQYALRDASVALFSGSTPPAHLKTLVPRIAPRPLMLIQAPNSPNGERLNDDYYRAAHEPKVSWAIPESRHIGGIEARPREYEKRVVGFFDAALKP